MAFDASLVHSLQLHGIATIKNVPGYAALRSEYLRAAATCAWQRRSLDGHSGILHSTLDDGTERLTISAIGGVDGLDASDCLEYQQRKQQFSDVVASAINKLSKAFDASLTPRAPANASESLHALVSEAEMMDHFHAYVPVRSTPSATNDARVATQADRKEAFALSMHSDSGVFIAMSAPAFFRVHTPAAAGALEALDEIANPDPAAGLLIKLANGTVVRPVQHADELTVMIGDGFSSWVHLPVAIPAVVHGMLMPQTCRRDAPVIRTWFGRMVLLPANAAMRNSDMDFAAYSRELGELVQHGEAFPAHFASVACPATRRLAVNACSYRMCHPFTLDISREQCAFWCNAHTMTTEFDFVALCQANCVCSHHAVTKDTYRCWMSCFEVDESCNRHQSCTTLVLSDKVPIPVRTCSDSPPPVNITTRHHRHHHRMHVKVTDTREAVAGASDGAV